MIVQISRWRTIGIRLPADPRLMQVLGLGTILAFGVWWRDFDLSAGQVILTFAAALCAESVSDRIAARPSNYRSALITSLSLTLLLRADSAWVHPVAAAVAIGSKSIFRFRRKHLFNPSCFGLIFALVAMPHVWLSPGQWGHSVALAGWIAVAGTMVVSRAARQDSSLTFVGSYGALLFGRVLWLGQRPAVMTHHLLNGSVLIFAFFMISDPRTSPDSRAGRVVHAAAVAMLAAVLEFHFYQTNPLMWALFLSAPGVMVFDAIFPFAQFNWRVKGERHEVGINPDDEHDRARDRNLARSANQRDRVLRLLRRES
ncbi:MAG: RnfABCDGE type electron transport complex subunit D [Candidatus Binataceae bacterium]|nr:RnfABCDGE type electron transport complex subunit D [Candidatus Binataceae bacterium]